MYEALGAHIARAHRLLLVSHVAPDGDAIGSLLGMTWLLRTLGKEVVAANPDGVPAPFRFLPGWEWVVSETADADFDMIISLDASDLARLGHIYQPKLHGGITLANIDHHVTNDLFGTINVVNSRASSTAEMIYQMAQALNWPLGPEAAQCLLAGVVTDTRCFRTSNVTATVLEVGQQLMQAGGSLSAITEHLINRRPSASICLWARALARASWQGRIIYTSIPYTMRLQCGASELGDMGLVNFLVTVEDADVAAVLLEREDGRIDVGLRAVPGADVSEAATALGGGGHPQASGCSLRMPLAEAEKRVLSALQRSLAQQPAPALQPTL